MARGTDGSNSDNQQDRNNNGNRDGQHSHPALFLLAEPAETETQLDRVDTRIGSRQAGIRNVHEAELGAQVVLAAQKMHTDGAAAREIDPRSSRRNLRVGEKRAAANFEIGNDAPARIERPFKCEWIHGNPIGGILLLKNQEGRHGFNGIFQAASEKAGPVRCAQNQAIAQADIPNAVAGLASIRAMTSAGPNLDFVLTLDRTGLRPGHRHKDKERKR